MYQDVALFDLGILLASRGDHSLYFPFFPHQISFYLFFYREFLTWWSLYFLFFFFLPDMLLFIFLQRIPSYKLIIFFNWR